MEIKLKPYLNRQGMLTVQLNNYSLRTEEQTLALADLK